MADYLLSFPPPESIPRDKESALPPSSPKKPKPQRETGIARAAVAAAARLVPGKSMGTRKSFTRGSAFSYDAESVMVESFMATERYNNDAHETRPIFERHASRGSMAFHSFVASTGGFHSFLIGKPAGLEEEEEETPNRRTQRQNSAGNVFRGARHSFGRRRFFSVSGATSTTPGGQLGESPNVANNGSNRNLRRYSRAMSGEGLSQVNSPPPTELASRGDRHSAAPRMLRRHASLETGAPRKMSA